MTRTPAGKTPASSKAAPSPAGAPAPELVAQGKARFDANKFFDCHGHNGEGTEDRSGPGPKTKLTGLQIADFPQKPASGCSDWRACRTFPRAALKTKFSSPTC